MPTASKDVGRSDAPPLAEVIDRVGFGYSQIKTGLCGGGVWMADGAELLLISSVGTQVADEWGLSPFEKGFIVTAVYFGELVGNVLSGPFGDAFGRRYTIILSYVLIAIFGLLSSYSVDVFTLCGARIVVGMGMGVGQPAWNALGSEVAPAYWRIPTQACSQALFPIGEVYAAVLLTLDDPTLTNLHWRDLLRLGTLPAVVILCFAFFLLRESPSFLSMKGQQEEAEEVLKGMHRDNTWITGGDDIDVVFQKPPPSPSRASRLEKITSQVNIVFGQERFSSTLLVMYTCFCLNLAYCGSLYAFPGILAQVLTSSSASAELIVGALWEIVGIALAFTVGLSMRRKTAMKTYLGLSILSFVLFCLGASASTDNWFMEAILKFGYYGTKVFVNMGYIIVYQYSVEIYPTPARITGGSLNLAAGRIAAMIAPVVYEWTASATSSFLPFFLGVAACMTVNGVAVDWLRYETSGVALSEHIKEEESPTNGKGRRHRAAPEQEAS